MKKLLLTALLSLSSFGAFAEVKTVTLEVPTMNCATCPITVKKSLENVDGVENAKVTYKPKLAVVSFDDTKTNINALIAATTNAGYPSNLKSENKYAMQTVLNMISIITENDAHRNFEKGTSTYFESVKFSFVIL